MKLFTCTFRNLVLATSELLLSITLTVYIRTLFHVYVVVKYIVMLVIMAAHSYKK